MNPVKLIRTRTIHPAIIILLCLPLLLEAGCGFKPDHGGKQALLKAFLFFNSSYTSDPSKPPALPAPATDLKGWQISESNTGLAGAGVDRSSLPLFEPPDDQVQYGSWYVPAGTVVSDRRIEIGGIIIDEGNITFERCFFHPLSIGSGMPLIYGDAAGPVIVRDCDFDGRDIPWNADGTNPANGCCAVSCTNIRVLRCNIRGLASGVALWGGEPVAMEGTYIHDLVQGEWVLGSGQSHQDGFTMRNFTGALALIRNNKIVTNPPSHMATGPVFFQATWSNCFLDNIYLEGNLLEGYGYSLVIERDNGVYGRHFWAVNNRINPYNGWTAYVERGPGWALWQDIFWDDPAQPDNRGNAVAEPLPQRAAGLYAPGSLVAAAEASGGIRLAWADNSFGETGFKVMRSTDGVSFTSITITGPNAVSYTDTGLAPGTAYHYRVSAVSNDGISGYSNAANATTPPAQ